MNRTVQNESTRSVKLCELVMVLDRMDYLSTK